MALINPQQAGAAGAALVFTAASASDTFRPHERGVVIYRTSGTATNLTIVVPGNNRHGVANPDPVIAAAATDNRAIAMAAYTGDTDPNTGLLTITASSVVGLTVAYVLA